MKKAWQASLRWLRRFRRSPQGRPVRPQAKDHPSVEMLSAYHDDQLPLAKDEEIREHLVDCAECPELMLDLDRFTSPEAVEAARREVSDNWVDAAWRRLRARLAAEARPARRFLRLLSSPGLAWSLTALLFPSTLGLWLRVDALAHEMRYLEAPQLNPPRKSVDPPRVVRGEAPLPCEVEIPAGARRFLLVLVPSGASHRSRHGYRLEIQTFEGEGLWSEPGLEESAEGFVVALSSRFLPAGDYRFLVTGEDGEEEPFREEFTLRLNYL